MPQLSTRLRWRAVVLTSVVAVMLLAETSIAASPEIKRLVSQVAVSGAAIDVKGSGLAGSGTQVRMGGKRATVLPEHGGAPASRSADREARQAQARHPPRRRVRLRHLPGSQALRRFARDRPRPPQGEERDRRHSRRHDQRQGRKGHHLHPRDPERSARRRHAHHPDARSQDQGVAPDRGLPAAVDFAPEGLQFARPARLTVTYKRKAPKNGVAYTYDENGQGFQLQSSEPSGRSLTTEIAHFSGAGTAGMTEQDLVNVINTELNLLQGRALTMSLVDRFARKVGLWAAAFDGQFCIRQQPVCGRATAYALDAAKQLLIDRCSEPFGRPGLNLVREVIDLDLLRGQLLSIPSANDPGNTPDAPDCASRLMAHILDQAIGAYQLYPATKSALGAFGRSADGVQLDVRANSDDTDFKRTTPMKQADLDFDGTISNVEWVFFLGPEAEQLGVGGAVHRTRAHYEATLTSVLQEGIATCPTDYDDGIALLDRGLAFSAGALPDLAVEFDEARQDCANLKIDPPSARLRPGAQTSFTATSSVSDPDYRWSATDGTLSPDTGVVVDYTAPSTPGSYTVALTEQLLPGPKAEANIVVCDPGAPGIPPPSAVPDDQCKFDLVMEITEPGDPVPTGDIVYDVKISNIGNSTAAGVSYAVKATATPGSGCTTGTGPTSQFVQVGDLPAGQSSNAPYTVHCDDDARVLIEATSFETSGPGTGEFDESNDRAALATDVSAQYDLDINVTEPSDPAPAGSVAYAVDVTNNGPSKAENVVLDFLSAADPGSACSELPSGARQIGDLASGASANETITLVCEEAGTAELSSEARADDPAKDRNPANNFEVVTTDIEPRYDLDVEVVEPADPAATESDADYDIEVTNLGSSTARNVVLDTIATDDPSGSCSQQPNDSVPIGDLAPGAGSTQTATVRCEDEADVEVEGVASADDPAFERDPANDSDSETTAFTGQYDLEVKLTEPGDPVPLGTISYEAEVRNKGPAAATDVGLTIASGDTAGACSQLVNESRAIGHLARDATATETITIVCERATSLEVSVKAEAPAASDLDPSNDLASEQTDVEVQYDLGVDITEPGDPVPPGDIVYDVAITNAGPSEAKNVGLDISSSAPASGDCSVLVNESRLIGDLPAGGSASDTATIVCEEETEVSVGMVVAADSPAGEQNPVDDSDSELTDVEARGLTIVSRSSSAVATMGGNLSNNFTENPSTDAPDGPFEYSFDETGIPAFHPTDDPPRRLPCGPTSVRAIGSDEVSVGVEDKMLSFSASGDLGGRAGRWITSDPEPFPRESHCLTVAAGAYTLILELQVDQPLDFRCGLSTTGSISDLAAWKRRTPYWVKAEWKNSWLARSRKFSCADRAAACGSIQGPICSL